MSSLPLDFRPEEALLSARIDSVSLVSILRSQAADSNPKSILRRDSIVETGMTLSRQG